MKKIKGNVIVFSLYTMLIVLTLGLNIMCLINIKTFSEELNWVTLSSRICLTNSLLKGIANDNTFELGVYENDDNVCMVSHGTSGKNDSYIVLSRRSKYSIFLYISRDSAREIKGVELTYE